MSQSQAASKKLCETDFPIFQVLRRKEGVRVPLQDLHGSAVREVTKVVGPEFSRDPAGRPDTILVNAAWGLGEGISQGELNGDLFWVSRSTGELIASECCGGNVRITLDPEKPGTMEETIPAEMAQRPCLDSDDLSRLASLARALEEATGRSQDVEFGFAADGTLMVFQVRRVVSGR